MGESKIDLCISYLLLYNTAPYHSVTQNSTDLVPRVPRGQGIMSPVFRQF